MFNTLQNIGGGRGFKAIVMICFGLGLGASRTPMFKSSESPSSEVIFLFPKYDVISFVSTVDPRATDTK